jgi:hypothetical protein
MGQSYPMDSKVNGSKKGAQKAFSGAKTDRIPPPGSSPLSPETLRLSDERQTLLFRHNLLSSTQDILEGPPFR